MDSVLLRRTAEIAAEYLASLAERPVRAEASLDELRSALRVPSMTRPSRRCR
jgi:hypothetical protein